MFWTLVASAVLMGLAGTPHCLAMCGAPCMALTGGRGAQAVGAQFAFHLGRMGSYAAGGAIAAAGVGGLALLGEAAPVLRPLWTLLHLAALGFGLWLVWQGRQPAWVERLWPRRPAAAIPGGWQRVRGPAAAGAAGSLWLAWPCALLQSALVVAALAARPAEGAAVMAAFAAASSIGLVAGPALWQRLALGGADAARVTAWAVRLAGAALALASLWVLGHGLWQRVWAWCVG